MNDLRIILLLIGLAAIVGIYAWEMRTQRDRQRRATVLHEAGEPRVSALRVPARAAEGDIDVKAGPGAGEAPPPEFDIPPETAAPGALPVIAVHVTALSGKTFNGPAIAAAAASAGLEHGTMKIFHYLGVDDSGQPRPLFSVANMFEPGYFEAAEMQGFSTRGLTLFMETGAADAALTLELMLKTAEFLAGALGGEVNGPDRRRLDMRAIQQLRAQVTHAAGAASDGEGR